MDFRGIRNGFDGEVGANWFAFATSLAAVALIGLILGATANGLLIADGASGLSGLQDDFEMLIFVGPLTLLFYAAGSSVGNKTFGFYPFVAYYLAQALLSEPGTELLATFIPSGSDAGPYPPKSTYAENLAAVFMAYVIVHCVAWPTRLFILAKPPTESAARSAAVSILAVVGLVATASVLFATPALASRQRSVHEVRLPVSGGLLADPSSRVLYTTDGELPLQIGRYDVEKLSFGSRGDLKSACGAGVSWNNRSATYTYAKSPGGIEYASGGSGGASSLTCFILDGRSYLVLSTGLSELAAGGRAWPPGEIVDAFAAGVLVVPNCAVRKESYCRAEDVARATPLLQRRS